MPTKRTGGFCRRGHAMLGRNVIHKGKYTACRECNRITENARRAHQRDRHKALEAELMLIKNSPY